MLHNGAKKLAYIEDSFGLIRKDIERITRQHGSDHVLVCHFDDKSGFSFNAQGQAQFEVIPFYSVNERLARKFSDAVRLKE